MSKVRCCSLWDGCKCDEAEGAVNPKCPHQRAKDLREPNAPRYTLRTHGDALFGLLHTRPSIYRDGKPFVFLSRPIDSDIDATDLARLAQRIVDLLNKGNPTATN